MPHGSFTGSRNILSVLLKFPGYSGLNNGITILVSHRIGSLMTKAIVRYLVYLYDISQDFWSADSLWLLKAISRRSGKNQSHRKGFSFQPDLVIQPCQQRPAALELFQISPGNSRTYNASLSSIIFLPH